jgi:exosortase
LRGIRRLGDSFSSPSQRQSTLSPRFGSSITSEYANQIKIAIIAISTLLIYFNDFYLTGSEALSSNYYNYVVLIPLMSGYLIYRKRKILSAILQNRDETYFNFNVAAGLGSLAVSVVLYMYGAVTSSPEDYHLISLEIFLGAAILLLFNRQTLKILLLPILLISAALPSAVEFGLSYWYQMAYLSAIPAAFVLKHLGLPVTSDLSNPLGPAIDITTSKGTSLPFVVSVASSGIYSLVGATLFFAFLGYIAKGPTWKKVVIFLSAYPLLLAVNIVREVILVSAAYLWGFAAFNAFHATSGIVLVFILTFFLLIIGERAFKLQIIPAKTILKYCSLCPDQFRNRSKFCANCGRFLGYSNNRLHSKDFLPAVAVCLVVLIFFTRLVPSVAVANAPTNTPLNHITDQSALNFLPKISGWNLKYQGVDYGYVEALSADAALAYDYASSQNSSLVINAEVLITSEVHIPQTSLISHCIKYFGATCATFYVQAEDVELLDQPPLVGQFMVFTYEPSYSEPTALIYWQEPALFNLGSSYETRMVQVQLLVPMSTLYGAHVINSQKNYTAAESFLLPLAIQTAKAWAPQGAISGLTNGVKKWSADVIFVAMLPSIAVWGIEKTESIKRWRTRRASDFLSQGTNSVTSPLTESMRDLLETIGITGARIRGAKKIMRKMTLREIVSSYKSMTGKEISFPDALTALTYAEYFGLAKRVIVDESDEPVLCWRFGTTLSNSQHASQDSKHGESKKKKKPGGLIPLISRIFTK